MSIPDGPVRTQQIDYKLRPIIAPKYKFVKLPMSNLASSSVSIGNSSAFPLEWKLPANTCYNLARSYWQYNLNVPGQATTFYSTTFEDVFELAQTVSFGAPGSQDLVNLQWASNYTKVARKLATSMDDFLTNDNMSGLYKCNSLAGDNYNPRGGTGNDAYIEPKYASSSVVGTAAANGEAGRLDRYRQIPLSVFTGTLLGVDRDFFSPTEMSLRLLTNIGDKMAFISTNVTNNFSAGAASVPDIAGSTCSGAGKGVTINNCYLFLCVEQNQDIIDSMFEKYRSGQMMYSIPYLSSFRLPGAAAAQQTNLQLTLSNMYGRYLKRILTTIWNPIERLNYAYDGGNIDGNKVKSYQTMLNSRPLQDRVLSCSRPALLDVNQDDWIENAKYMDKQGCITSKEQYSVNWFHIDQFYEPRDSNQLPEVNLSQGLEMIAPVTWQFSGVSAMAGCIYYIYAEFQRDIMITPGGPVFAPIV